MGAAGDRGGADGFEEAAEGDVDVEEVVEAVVGDCVGGVDGEEVVWGKMLGGDKGGFGGEGGNVQPTNI